MAEVVVKEAPANGGQMNDPGFLNMDSPWEGEAPAAQPAPASTE